MFNLNNFLQKSSRMMTPVAEGILKKGDISGKMADTSKTMDKILYWKQPVGGYNNSLAKSVEESLNTSDKVSNAPDKYKVIMVDSGIGGAMTTNLIKQNVQEFGHTQCLPIGEKGLDQRISFTAHMSIYGLIHDKASDVIIACNTASVQKEPACEVICDFVMRQAEDLDKGVSIYKPGSEEAVRLLELANEINLSRSDEDPKGVGAIRSRIHEIVTPTANLAAGQAVSALLGENKPDYLIRVDSTTGTCESELYPSFISNQVAKEMKAAGYKVVVSGEKNTPVATVEGMLSTKTGSFTASEMNLPEEANTRTTVGIKVYDFVHEKTNEKKQLLIQSRGNNPWVPAIEAGVLDEISPKTKQTVGQSLAAMADADAIYLTQDMLKENKELAKRFAQAPDLNMMCCTHYPAMKGPISEALGVEKAFITQDTIVKELFEKLTVNQADGVGRIGITPEMPETQKPEKPYKTAVRLGLENISRDVAEKTENMLQTVAEASPGIPLGTRHFQVSGIGDKFPTFLAEHKEMEYERSRSAGIRPQDTEAVSSRVNAENRGFGEVRDKALMLWERNIHSDNPASRGDALFRGSLKNPAPIEGSLGSHVNATDRLINKYVDISSSQITKLKYTLAQIADTLTQGEKRGLDILAGFQEPGEHLTNASVRLADLILSNQDFYNMGNRIPAALVTGFTVVDDNGEKVGGENDGPLGTVVLAKFLLDNGSPVILICDKGSESSLFAASKVMGLIEKDENLREIPEAEKVFAASELRNGLEIKIASGKEVDWGKDNCSSLEEIDQSLVERQVDLMISIERPGVSKSGISFNMKGQDVSQHNVDMSLLFSPDKGRETIGIGDGGNEIGMGDLSDDISSMRKPDYTPVVNNGKQIASQVRTDHTILSSVSNNGAVGLAVAADITLRALNPNEEKPSSSPMEIIGGYMEMIDPLVEMGMSIDGVSKTNEASVDGRRVSRPEGLSPQPLGASTATHQDMFEQILGHIQGN